MPLFLHFRNEDMEQTPKSPDEITQTFFFFFFFFVFLGLHPRHMAVPRLGVISELELTTMQLLAYTIATATGCKPRLQSRPQVMAMQDPLTH